MSRASCPVFAMRAWHSTCLPASRVASVRVRCIYGHVPIRTASTPSSSSNSSQPPYGLGISNSSVTRWLDSRLRFATATISHPAIRRRAGSITLRTFAPAPMIPTRIIFCTDRLLVALSGAELGGSGGSHKRENSHGKKRSAIQSPSSLAIESVAHFRLCTRRVGRVPNEGTKPGRSSSRSAYRGVESHARLD